MTQYVTCEPFRGLVMWPMGDRRCEIREAPKPKRRAKRCGR